MSYEIVKDCNMVKGSKKVRCKLCSKNVTPKTYKTYTWEWEDLDNFILHVWKGNFNLISRKEITVLGVITWMRKHLIRLELDNRLKELGEIDFKEELRLGRELLNHYFDDYKEDVLTWYYYKLEGNSGKTYPSVIERYIKEFRKIYPRIEIVDMELYSR